MKIERNKSVEQWAIEEIQNNWGNEAREGIHLTDLLTPRRKYWQVVKPLKASIKEISYWTSGSAIEAKILAAMGYAKGGTKEWKGIKYSVDTFLGNIPAEIKTRRRALAEEGKEEEIYEHYLKQLLGYCAIENSTKAWLIVLSMLEYKDATHTEPEWAFYDVSFDENELEDERKRLIETKLLLEDALKNKNPDLLPYCPKWMCARTLKIMTKKPYCITCNKEFETEWGANKHISSKTGAGHEIMPAEYEIKAEKICKYYDDCKPVLD